MYITEPKQEVKWGQSHTRVATHMLDTHIPHPQTPPPLTPARMHNAIHSMTQCLSYAINWRPDAFMTQFNTQVCVWKDSGLPFKFLNYEAFVDNVEIWSFYLIEDKENLHCKGKLILYRQRGLWEKCKVWFVKHLEKNVFRSLKLLHFHKENG